MAEAKVYKTYEFSECDPVLIELSNIQKKLGAKNIQVEEISGVSAQTLGKWHKGAAGIDGGTRRPQHATIMAVTRALGYDFRLVKVRVNRQLPTG